MVTRTVSEIERCALTLLGKSNVHYGPLDWARDQFLADTATEREERWDVLSLYGLNTRDDDEPVSHNWWWIEYTEKKACEGYTEYRNIREAYHALIGETQPTDRDGAHVRWERDQDQAAVNLMFAIMGHREAEARGESGDRFQRLDMGSGLGVITSLAANIVEYHQALLDAYALFVDRRYTD